MAADNNGKRKQAASLRIAALVANAQGLVSRQGTLV